MQKRPWRLRSVLLFSDSKSVLLFLVYLPAQQSEIFLKLDLSETLQFRFECLSVLDPGPGRKAPSAHQASFLHPPISTSCNSRFCHTSRHSLAEAPAHRSEERRVGKECRSRWSP